MYTIIPVCNEDTLKNSFRNAFATGEKSNIFLLINCGNSINLPAFMEELRHQYYPEEEGPAPEFTDNSNLVVVMDNHRPIVFENLDPTNKEIVIVDDKTGQDELDLVLAPTPEGTKTEAEIQLEIDEEEEEERLEMEREQLGTNDFEEIGQEQLTEAEREERERRRQERREHRRKRQKSQEQIMREREVCIICILFIYLFLFISLYSATSFDLIFISLLFAVRIHICPVGSVLQPHILHTVHSIPAVHTDSSEEQSDE